MTSTHSTAPGASSARGSATAPDVAALAFAAPSPAVVALKVPRTPLGTAVPFLGLLLPTLAATSTRPSWLPAPVQRTADCVTATVVLLHPLEAYLVHRKMSGDPRVSASERRRTTFSALVFGVTTVLPAMRALRRKG